MVYYYDNCLYTGSTECIVAGSINLQNRIVLFNFVRALSIMLCLFFWLFNIISSSITKNGPDFKVVLARLIKVVLLSQLLHVRNWSSIFTNWPICTTKV